MQELSVLRTKASLHYEVCGRVGGGGEVDYPDDDRHLSSRLGSVEGFPSRDAVFIPPNNL